MSAKRQPKSSKEASHHAPKQPKPSKEVNQHETRQLRPERHQQQQSNSSTEVNQQTTQQLRPEQQQPILSKDPVEGDYAKKSFFEKSPDWKKVHREDDYGNIETEFKHHDENIQALPIGQGIYKVESDPFAMRGTAFNEDEDDDDNS